MIDAKITALLIDDEPMALSAIERMLTKHCSNIIIIGKTKNPEEAVDLINNLKPEILFLDIAMPRMDGFTLLNSVSYKKSQVIFTTAYDEYALQAFKTAAADYLLKPIDPDELKQAVIKVSEQLQSDDTQNYIADLFERLQKNTKSITSIGLPSMEGLDFVKTEAIIYCKSDGNYTEIYLDNNQKILVTRKLKFLEEKLNDSQFVRVHNSYLVNINFVKKYLKGRGGTLVMSNGDSLPVSVRKKNDFLDAF
ncbi:LytTR family DNA-binding domain-containing protein [Ichthyenterobacterium sp. W332]|uniref:LytTR family DNA-binding domain-containing protein n=1 Tax=Microcosmobacter mediterraneus TaxID=3075607 RepID=A0ABU2YIM1_9FLAO|nr:LytTR family DNA-binding domain-containing protein [Ichthyenterobacterium sp. W332]MDT0557080.1 LytTR family DNA-binding domain-containing protein [Ichthyenterobacterium sp. W332]